MNRDPQKFSPPKQAEHHSFTADNRPSAPPTPPLDLPEDINLIDFEDRLAKPSAFLKTFATESLKHLGGDHNNQKTTKATEDTNLRFDIDDIFSKFSHLSNYSNPNVPIVSQESTVENQVLLSDGSSSPALEEEVESPQDSDNFFNTSRYNDSAKLNDKNELYQPSDELNLSDLNENKREADIEYQEKMHDTDRKIFHGNNDSEQMNESVKDEKRPVSDCHVCGDRAIAHMHYGGICCYSCKAFFRRAVQNGKDKTYKCKKDSDCEVSVITRRGCQKCRFEKCQEIGMTASWVLSDEQCEIRFGKGIILDFGSIPSGVSCSDVTIEVRKGTENKDDASGPLFGSYCSTSGSLVIKTRSAALRIKITMAIGAIPKGTNFGQWTTEDLTCCDKVMVEDLSGQTSSNGLYTKMTDGTTVSGVPVYKNSDGSNYLFLSSMSNVWVIGPDHTSNSIGVKSSNGDFCPEDSVGWQYYDGSGDDGGWADDSDAKARCSDCDLYPTNHECITCCDTMKIETTSSLGGYGVFAGTYAPYSTTPTYNDQKVYQLAGEDYCLYFHCN